MFGNKSKPSRIFSFGANAPIKSLEIVEKQLRLAHEYRNDLVALEIKRRKLVAEKLKKLEPELERFEREIGELSGKIDALVEQKKQTHVRERKRSKDPSVTAQITKLKADRKKLYELQKKTKDAVFGSESWKAFEVELEGYSEERKGTKKNGDPKKKKIRVDGSISAERKRLQNQVAAAGLFWGTYNAINESMKSARQGAPPKFRRWTGEGKIQLQIQGGMSVDEAMSLDDNWLRIAAHKDGVWVPGTRRPAVEAELAAAKARGADVSALQAKLDKIPVKGRKIGTAIASFRIGSSDDRAPIMVDVPFHMHRPLPGDASIKYVWLIKRRIGTGYRWTIQFVVSKDSWEKSDSATSGTIALDIGWRVMEDGRLRVAAWVDDDGKTGELSLPGPYVLPPSAKHPDGQRRLGWLKCYERTESTHACRDRDLNTIKVTFVAWIRDHEIPDWLRERLSAKLSTKEIKQEIDESGTAPAQEVAGARRMTIAWWRSQARLASVVIHWRNNRFDGDETMFNALEEWRKHDKHHYEYEANERDQLQKNRSDIYRCFAAFLRRNYARVIMEARSKNEENPERLMDLRTFHEIPPVEAPPESPGQKGSRAKEHVRDACLSSLRMYIVEAVGAGVSTVPAPGTTMIHAACESVEQIDGVALMHTCSSCGETYDQDFNAAKNMLRGVSLETPASV